MSRLLFVKSTASSHWWSKLARRPARGCVLASFLLMFFASSVLAANPSVVAPGAKPQILADSGFAFTEGPAADAKGNVFFTDEPNNRIIKWSAEDGSVSTWLKPAGHALGTYFDKAGNLVIAAGENGELWSVTPDKKVTIIVSTYQGKVFNGPNDLWIHPNGGIYFTDYNFESMRDPNLQMDGAHVYFITPDRKTVTRVTHDLKNPNGIIGTPDGRLLYVADYAADKIYAYKIGSDGTLTDKRLFFSSISDGMTIDVEGNVYLTRYGVTVVNSAGEKVEHIDVPDWTTNVTFGGKDGDLLFVTARAKVYGLKMRVKGAR